MDNNKNEYNSLEEVAKKIKETQKDITLLFAFNGIGKTRLSMEFKNLVNEKNSEENEIKHIMYYNAYTEDLFSWDNDLESDTDRKYKINTFSSFVSLLKNQGKEKEVVEKFKSYMPSTSKIEPRINYKNGEVQFNVETGDENRIENIKISRGEESIFIWSIFYVLIDTIISELNEEDEERSISDFKDIQYIYIDDPISSLDEGNAINVALDIIDLIKSSENNIVKFIISTHHPLFFNVLHNGLRRKKSKEEYSLNYENSMFDLSSLKDGSPFGYHLLLVNEIKQAIKSRNIRRYHFNLLRNIMEKTAHFLGEKNWRDILPDKIADHEVNKKDKEGYIRTINHYSHYDYNDLDAKELEGKDKTLLKNIFEAFVMKYHFELLEENNGEEIDI
jgi:hypothetical protein